MAKSKPSKKEQKSKQNGSQEVPIHMAGPLFEQATELLQEGQPDHALPIAQKLVQCLSGAGVQGGLKLPALDLLGEIYVELGAPDDARNVFLEAVKLDPTGDLGDEIMGGADKFLWLAQLCEEGGAESVKWFEQGAMTLRKELAKHDGDKTLTDEEEFILAGKRSKLANALCGAAEVYMTDLSWEEDAEQRCEALVTEACMVAPDSPEPLQTLASVRLSQEKVEDARSALTRSMDMWTGLDADDLSIPDFPTRVSLVRLLVEAEMEEQAIDVLERLIEEDDESVEAWYLGGWCLQLIAEKAPVKNAPGPAADNDQEEKLKTMKSSRIWLIRCLKLYTKLEYEDERLKEHAEQLVAEMNKVLGPPPEDENADDEDDEWEGLEDEDDNEDEVMEGT